MTFSDFKKDDSITTKTNSVFYDLDDDNWIEIAPISNSSETKLVSFTKSSEVEKYILIPSSVSEENLPTLLNPIINEVY